MASGKKTRATTEESLHLPEEIIEQILARVRVKSLLRLRCVSKSWLSLIDSKRFIENHLQYSTKNRENYRVIMYTVTERKPKQCSLHALLGANPSPLGHQIWRGSVCYASYCKGLLCIYGNERFVLLNPSTRAFKELPDDPETKNSHKRLFVEKKIGFGWDESSGAYKVFDGLMNFSRVYSSKTNSWKRVEDPHLPTNCEEGKFVGGKLHWLSIRFKIISSFDLKSEVFGMIELPVDMKSGGYAQLGVVGGCLCLSAEYFSDPKRPLDLWVMKESWEKLPTIHPGDELLHVLCHQYFKRVARVIGEATNGEILIAFGMNLLVYCPKNGVIRHCPEIIGCYFEALYVESLVSPVREISSV